MDLELLTATLEDLGQPAYRERQVWRWTDPALRAATLKARSAALTAR